MSISTPSHINPNSTSVQPNASHERRKINIQAEHVGISTVAVLDAHHLSQHRVALEPARRVTVHALRNHTEFHRHTVVASGLLDVMLLLSAAKGKVRRLARVLKTLLQRLVIPPRWEESGNTLGLADEAAEGFLPRWLEVVDRTDHGLAVEVVFVLLTHTYQIDEELEGLLLRAVVEECVLADGREWFGVLFGGRRRLHVRLSAGLRLAPTLRAALLVDLPVCLLTVFVAVAGRLAAGTVEERNVGCSAGSARASFSHCCLDRHSVQGMHLVMFLLCCQLKNLVNYFVGSSTYNAEEIEELTVLCSVIALVQRLIGRPDAWMR